MNQEWCGREHRLGEDRNGQRAGVLPDGVPIRAEVNGDRGPGISERKLGESSVVFLINSEGGDDR